MNRYDLVLLGFLVEKDSCGYDIITAIRQRELDRWAKISVSTIYNRLQRLEKGGYIVGRAEKEGNRPERTTYNITDKGKDLLKKEVKNHLCGFNDDPRTLGYAFLYGVDAADAIRTMQAHETNLVREIDAIERMIAEEPRPTLHPEGPFLNCMSRDHMKVELKYVRAALDILRDPEKAKKLGGYFWLNFGAREFQKQLWAQH